MIKIGLFEYVIPNVRQAKRNYDQFIVRIDAEGIKKIFNNHRELATFLNQEFLTEQEEQLTQVKRKK